MDQWSSEKLKLEETRSLKKPFSFAKFRHNFFNQSVSLMFLVFTVSWNRTTLKKKKKPWPHQTDNSWNRYKLSKKRQNKIDQGPKTAKLPRRRPSMSKMTWVIDPLTEAAAGGVDIAATNRRSTEALATDFCRETKTGILLEDRNGATNLVGVANITRRSKLTYDAYITSLLIGLFN